MARRDEEPRKPDLSGNVLGRMAWGSGADKFDVKNNIQENHFLNPLEELNTERKRYINRYSSEIHSP